MNIFHQNSIKIFFLISLICGLPSLALADEINVINACQLKVLGTLRIVSDSSKCRKNFEVPLTWNVIGPTGAKGDKGDPGIAGAAGPKGDQGPAGLGFASADDAKLLNVLRYDGADTVTFTGVNVKIVNGEGDTRSTNGFGNLIIGYNEPSNRSGMRTGSHNLVIGFANDYTQYSGIVVGTNNIIQGAYATVLGGGDNIASGHSSSVSGGVSNTASGEFSSIGGGYGNTASGQASNVSGGGPFNTASGQYSSVSGGAFNTASGQSSSISGGNNNFARGSYSSVSGGYSNTSNGIGTSISGGENNLISGDWYWTVGNYHTP